MSGDDRTEFYIMVMSLFALKKAHSSGRLKHTLHVHCTIISAIKVVAFPEICKAMHSTHTRVIQTLFGWLGVSEKINIQCQK